MCVCVCDCFFRVQKDDSPQNSFMYLSHNGIISSEEDVRVISTCKMDVYKFPFDTQKCNITIGSAIHSGKDVPSLSGPLTMMISYAFTFNISHFFLSFFKSHHS